MAMKKLVLIACCICSMIGSAQQDDNGLAVMSFNIRYNNPDDGINVWENRKEWLTKSIRFFEADLVGAQEVTYPQLQDMEAFLPSYRHVGIGREGGNKGEFSPIFYRSDRFELLESNTFWLSKTPGKVGSKGWDAALPRIVTWAKFKDKGSGKTFFLFNTHFDHRGKTARKKSAELIAKEIERIAGDSTVILTGDFNTPPNSGPYNTITESDLKDVFPNLDGDSKYGTEYTTNGWDIEAGDDRDRIDYVFYKGKKIAPLRYHVLDGQRGNRFISDHFPVLVHFHFTDSPKQVDAQNRKSLRIMAYNIHHANPPSRSDSIDIPAIVRTIRAQDPDLVALQEIDGNTERSGEGNQAEIIADSLVLS
jgi:endonuclease/exonuclease/phosphatase family metal-dependent hydrolase